MKTWIPDSRNLAYLNWKQVDALPRESTLLVLPTAAIEQHGHHLPLATDTLINNLLLGRALEKLPAELLIYALPPVHYGKSNEHIGFPGTLSVSASTFMAVLRDLGASIASAGFKKLVLYNTHGGNTSLIDVMARDLRAEFGLRTFALHGSAGVSFEGLSPQERTYGFHAGEVETSFLLASVPELVDRSAYTVIARALATSPQLLLMDEPFAALDEMSRDRLNEELLRLRAEQKWTAVFVTHSVEEAVFLSTRIIVLAPNPGRIHAEFPVDLPAPRAAALRDTPRFDELMAQVSRALREAMVQRASTETSARSPQPWNNTRIRVGRGISSAVK
jgi:creatinine amidohydrolase